MRIPIVWICGLLLLMTAAFATPARAQDAPTDAPALNTPVDQDSILVTTPAVVLGWDVVERATTHEVQLFYTEPVDGLEPIPLKTRVLSDATQELDVAELLAFVDAAGADGDSTFHWRVRGRNAAGEGPWSEVWEFTLVQLDGTPVIDVIDAQVIDELTTLTLDVNATSPTGSVLTYSLDQASLDAGMTINPDTGVLSWTPGEDQGPGAYEVTLTVTDAEGRSASQTFTINVNEVNLPPVLAAISDTTVAVGTGLTLMAVATDPDIPENTLTYSLDQASLDAGMTINPATGEIAWTPTVDQDMMSFEVTVTVTDDGDPVASDAQTFTIQVGGGAPVIDVIDAQVIDELTTLTLDVNATSPTGSVLTYSLDQASLDAGMTINPDTGVLSWTPGEDQGPGAYEVTLTVTDAEGRSASQTFTINVNEVNLPPVLAAIADTTAEVGAELRLTASATDPDIPANTLSYSLDQASLDLGITIDPATGEIVWTPASGQPSGTYTVTVTVTDDGNPAASDSQTFIIILGDVMPPVFTPIADQNIDELLVLTFVASATDPAGSALTYTLDQSSLDAGMMINPATGEFTWTPSEEQGPGEYNVTVTVTNAEGLSAAESLIITVNEVNLPPVLDVIADARTIVGDALNFSAAATDPDIPVNGLTFTLDQASIDAGMSIDPITGAFTWTPGVGQGPATYTVAVTVTDDGEPAASDTKTFVITVDATLPPTSNPETAPFCSAAADFDLRWSALDPTQFDMFIVQIAQDAGFTNIISETTSSTFTAKAPLSNLDFGVVYYWRVITEQGGVQSTPSIGSAFSRWPAEIEVAHTLTYPKATASADFRMISVPGQSNSIPLASTFAGTQAPAGPLRINGAWDWSVWRDNSNSAEYPGYLDQTISNAPFAPGVGFWAISKSVWQVPQQIVQNAPLNEDRFFPIPLNQGNGAGDLRWTMIGNPFDFPVLWQDLIDENELTQRFDLWDWTGQGYESVSILQPYKGYYYFNSKNDPSLQIPCILTPVDAATQTVQEPSGPALALSLHKDKLASSAVSTVKVLAREEAGPGFDPFDRAIPPAYFETHRVTLINKNMDVDYPYLVEEARTSFDKEQVFNVELKSVVGEPAYLRIDGLQTLADREVYLFDDASGRAFDMHEDAVVRIEPGKEITQLRLLIGDADFIAAEKASLLPDDFKMMQSYPNPFVDQTTIEYTLPAPEFVTLEVYNVLGQRIRTLVNGEQIAGYHQVAWDGRGDAGESVASGMYLYVFKSQSHHATERLVRVR